MISTEFYDGQGLGNQLWCYVTTRVIAFDHGYGFGIEHPEKFKGYGFLNLDFGKKIEGITNRYEEKKIIHPISGADVRIYDKNLVNVADNTKIDGYMQDEQYIIHHKDEIKKWLTVKKEYECLDYSSDDICVINFRGTGYVNDKDFFLPKKYWQDAIANMKKINPNFKFIVVTEDVKNAKKFFPDFEINHWNIAKDYVVIKNAHYLILSNSSFAWFPAWTSDTLKYAIAPKYWGRHNISDGYWSLGYNITTTFTYQDRSGNLQNYDSCLEELKKYEEGNKEIFSGEIPYRPTCVTKIRNIVSIFKALSKESSSIQALFSIVKFTASKTKVSIKIKLWKTFGPRTENGFIKSLRRYAKKIVSLKTNVGDWILFKKNKHKIKKTWLEPDKISEYRKTIKIYDVFPFFNELDLLEIRLNILDPYVDYFVLIEATETFSGYPKPLYYHENKERYRKWEKKIIHYVITDAPKDEDDLRKRLENKKIDNLNKEIIENALKSSAVGKDAAGKSIPAWLREFYIKESIKKALIKLEDNDICYLSDLDEIWNPELVIDYTKDDVFKLIQKPYLYYLNNRSNENWRNWSGTIVTKYKNIKKSYLNYLRDYRKMKSKYTYINHGGWHFGFQGGAVGAKRKIEESKHFWYNPEETLPNLAKRVEQNKDLRGRDTKLWIDEKGLPKYLLENKEKYKQFFK